MSQILKKQNKHRYVIKINGQTWQYYRDYITAYDDYRKLLKLYDDSFVMLHDLEA